MSWNGLGLWGRVRKGISNLDIVEGSKSVLPRLSKWYTCNYVEGSSLEFWKKLSWKIYFPPIFLPFPPSVQSKFWDSLIVQNSSKDNNYAFSFDYHPSSPQDKGCKLWKLSERATDTSNWQFCCQKIQTLISHIKNWFKYREMPQVNFFSTVFQSCSI